MNDRSYILAHRDHPHYLSDTKIARLQHALSVSTKVELVQMLKQLSDPTKLKIYQLLRIVPEIVVSDIAIILDISKSAVSHALGDLKKAGIVEAHRCGQLICYSLTTRQRKRAHMFLKFI